MTAWIRLSGFFIVALLSLQVGASEPPRLQDFAYGMDIRTEGQGAIYRLDLPVEVYQGITRTDLADLRVFNAGGQVTPHSIGPAPKESSRAWRKFELPLFPLYEDSPLGAADIRLRIEQWDDNRRMRLEQRRRVKGQRLIGYILDARDVKLSLRRFKFSWNQGDFLLRVRLQGGNDLENWRTLVDAAGLADMRHLGHHLLRDRIAVKSSGYDYYRLLFDDPDKAVVFSSALAWGSHSTRIRRYQTTSLTVTPGPGSGEYLFELPPALEVERLRIRLPEQNTLAPVVLSFRPKKDQPWREHSRPILYRLQHKGVELEQDDLAFNMRGQRLWRLSVDESGGGLGTGLPRIEVMWQPHELRFVARGEPPFTLAWGSGRPLSKGQNGADRLLKSTGLSPLPATLEGPVRQLAGDQALQTPVDWRRLLLWGVLLFGAVLLVWMALRLFRQMNNTSS